MKKCHAVVLGFEIAVSEIVKAVIFIYDTEPVFHITLVLLFVDFFDYPHSLFVFIFELLYFLVKTNCVGI